ncbi:hypothetical protein ACFL34_06250, partial [Candidatus Sumerlaeota bacterium]
LDAKLPASGLGVETEPEASEIDLSEVGVSADDTPTERAPAVVSPGTPAEEEAYDELLQPADELLASSPDAPEPQQSVPPPPTEEQTETEPPPKPRPVLLDDLDLSAEAMDLGLDADSLQGEQTVVNVAAKQDALFQAQYARGLKAFEEEKWREAIHCFSIALALDKSNTAVREQLRLAREYRRKQDA